MLSARYFLLSYKKKFVTKFVTCITKFVTCVSNFVTAVTKFLIKNIRHSLKNISVIIQKVCADRKKCLRRQQWFS